MAYGFNPPCGSGMRPGPSFFPRTIGGYTVPDPTASSDDLDKFLNRDLWGMDALRLKIERKSLIDALSEALRPDAARAFIPYPMSGSGCGSAPFDVWARIRLENVEREMRYGRR